jgi:hypothetical protein
MRAAYDPTSGAVIAYGGSYWPPGAAQGTAFFDTWEWDGITWAQVATTGPRLHGEMTFDSTLGEVLLLGFSQVGSMETWVWSGGVWQQLHPANSPSNRVQAGLTDDPNAKQVVLFGGYDSGSGYHNDTWVWNGSKWVESPQTDAPSPRLDPPMAFDNATGQIVMQGGGGPTSLLKDTWTWNGQRWMEVASTQSQLDSEIQSTACGVHVCAVEAGQNVWQWEAGKWAAAN